MEAEVPPMPGKWPPFPAEAWGTSCPFDSGSGTHRPPKPPSPSHRDGKVQCTCQSYPFCTTLRQLYLTGSRQNPAPPIRNPPPIVVVRALTIESTILGKLGGGVKWTGEARRHRASLLKQEAVFYLYILCLVAGQPGFGPSGREEGSPAAVSQGDSPLCC